ncbi:rhomboid family intramembrane serine protease [Candidatus Bathyarchaeota archaeon]|nr:rhomboid family intramembrane serine protease [Candidatus Bathyarchaeota archaeon]
MYTEYKPKWTYIFIILSISVYLLIRTTHTWIYLAFTPALITRYPWTIITSIFLHLDLNHLLFNMFALFFFGTVLETRISQNLFATLFITSGVIGNLGHYYTAGTQLIPVLGASGAIYGVIGALAVLEPFRLVYFTGMVPLPMILAAALWALSDLAGLFTPSQIAHNVHLVGMLIGVLTGVYLRHVEKIEFDH